MTQIVKEFVINYNRYKQLLKRRMRNSVDIDDVMQITFIALSQTNVEPDDVSGYIKAAIFNNYLRFIKRKKVFSTRVELTDELLVTNVTPEGILKDKQLRTELHKSMNNSTKLDKIMRARILDGMSYEEIAEKMSLSTDQVKTNIKVNKFNGKLDYLREFM